MDKKPLEILIVSRGPTLSFARHWRCASLGCHSFSLCRGDRKSQFEMLREKKRYSGQNRDSDRDLKKKLQRRMRRIREEVKSSFYGKKRQKRSHRRRKYTTSVFKHAAILFQISPFCNKTCSQMILITSDAKVITFATKHVNDELSLVLERKMRKVLLSLRVLLHSNHSYAEYKVTTLYSRMLLHPNGKLDKNRDFRLKG